MRAKLGIALIHARPYQPAGKWKIERFFRTLRAAVLAHLTTEATESLETLNRTLWAFVEGEYHLQERAWYHCERCHQGFSPRDRALGMEDTPLSSAALRMVGIAAAKTSFEGSSASLRELAGLAVAPKTVERHPDLLLQVQRVQLRTDVGTGAHIDPQSIRLHGQRRESRHRAQIDVYYETPLAQALGHFV